MNKSLRIMAAFGAAAAYVGAGAQSNADTFSFAAIGDMPYSTGQENTVDAVLRAIDASPVSFILHDGDIKARMEPCSDAFLTQRIAQLQQSQKPLFLVLGDNEWTDCRDVGQDPLDRLRFLRTLVYKNGTSLGKHPRPVQQQTAALPGGPYVENIRFIEKGVVFIGLNMPGSKNNLKPGFFASDALKAEHGQRDAANMQWLNEGFALAHSKNAPAVVVFAQGNPFKQQISLPCQFKDATQDHTPEDDGYLQFKHTLAQRAVEFGKPVLFIHGDTHSHRVTRSNFKTEKGTVAENITRLETYGVPCIQQWVEVKVNTQTPEVFQIQTRALENLPQ